DIEGNLAHFSFDAECQLPLAVGDGPHLAAFADLDESWSGELRHARSVNTIAIVEDAGDQKLPILERRLELDRGRRDFELDEFRVGREFFLSNCQPWNYNDRNGDQRFLNHDNLLIQSRARGAEVANEYSTSPRLRRRANELLFQRHRHEVADQ